jgi:hypothetical protein
MVLSKQEIKLKELISKKKYQNNLLDNEIHALERKDELIRALESNEDVVFEIQLIDHLETILDEMPNKATFIMNIYHENKGTAMVYYMRALLTREESININNEPTISVKFGDIELSNDFSADQDFKMLLKDIRSIEDEGVNIDIDFTLETYGREKRDALINYQKALVLRFREVRNNSSRIEPQGEATFLGRWRISEIPLW